MERTRARVDAEDLDVESFETAEPVKSSAEYEGGTCSGLPCTPCCIEITCSPDC